jgi:acyl-CoA synthetase (AMP-forming)/AMP-acid ligase II
MSDPAGLVEGILQPAFNGYPAWLMSPRAFVERPRRWLHAISTLRATHSGAPGFGFDLCVRRVSGSDRAGLDLSSWRVAFSGGTRLSHATIDAFARAFRPAGFEGSAFRPFVFSELPRPALSCLNGGK